uniref:Uncharacterized protein n=1 Tax=Ascaris lumbricoides TaxID=6252 RepID=A0A9J2Q2Q2_ASCLU
MPNTLACISSRLDACLNGYKCPITSKIKQRMHKKNKLLRESPQKNGQSIKVKI